MDKSKFDIISARRKGWEQMETLLDKELGKDRKPFLTYLPYAASIVLMVTVGLFYYQTQQPQQISFSDNLKVLPIEEYDLYTANLTKILPVVQNPSISEVKKAGRNQSKLPKENQHELLQNILVKTNVDLSKKPLTKTPKSVVKVQNSIPKVDVKFKSKQAVKSFKVENNIADAQANRRQQLKRENKFVSNAGDQSYRIMSSIDIRNTLAKPNLNFGLQTNGSLGLVSKDMQDFGMRVGFELSKPLNNKFSLNTGLRYSTYKDSYNSTYDVKSESDNHILQQLSHRDVNRNFIELPVYADYNLIGDIVSIKGGFSITYNNNNSDNTDASPMEIAANGALSDAEKIAAGNLLEDKHGYLGEAVLGASIELDKIIFDVEGTYGLISNQKIDNRNIVGARISYRFGK